MQTNIKTGATVMLVPARYLPFLANGDVETQDDVEAYQWTEAAQPGRFLDIESAEPFFSHTNDATGKGDACVRVVFH